MHFSNDGSALLGNPDYGDCEPSWNEFYIQVSKAPAPPRPNINAGSTGDDVAIAAGAAAGGGSLLARARDCRDGGGEEKEEGCPHPPAHALLPPSPRR